VFPQSGGHGAAQRKGTSEDHEVKQAGLWSRTSYVSRCWQFLRSFENLCLRRRSVRSPCR